MSGLDDVLTPEQQLLLKKAIMDAGQGKADEYGFVWLEVSRGQVRRIVGGRSYDSTPAALSAAVAGVMPMGKRRRRG